MKSRISCCLNMSICLHFQSVDIHFFTLTSTFTAINGSVTHEHLSHAHEENFTFYDFVVFFIVFDHANPCASIRRWSKYTTILLISHYFCLNFNYLECRNEIWRFLNAGLVSFIFTVFFFLLHEDIQFPRNSNWPSNSHWCWNTWKMN